jgi:hypothetical protein
MLFLRRVKGGDVVSTSPLNPCCVVSCRVVVLWYVCVVLCCLCCIFLCRFVYFVVLCPRVLSWLVLSAVLCGLVLPCLSHLLFCPVLLDVSVLWCFLLSFCLVSWCPAALPESYRFLAFASCSCFQAVPHKSTLGLALLYS